MTVCVQWLFLMVLWVALQCVISVFPVHAIFKKIDPHFLYANSECTGEYEIHKKPLLLNNLISTQM